MQPHLITLHNYICYTPVMTSVELQSVSIEVVYFTDRAQCKTLLSFIHPQTFDGYFCCHVVWYSGPRTASCPAAYSVRLSNRQLWTANRAVTLPCDSVRAVCAEDVRRLSILCLRLSYCVRL